MKTQTSQPTFLRPGMALVLAGAALFGATSAHAELIAYEGFNYDTQGIFGPNDLLGEGEAVDGWSGTWIPSRHSTQNGQSPIQEGSLSYTDANGNVLETSGNHVEVRGQDPGQNTTVGRGLVEPLDTTPGKVYYISFIGVREGEPTNPEGDWWDNPDTPEVEEYPYGTNLYPRAAGLRLLPNAAGNDLSGLVGTFSNRSTNLWRYGSAATEIESQTEFTTQAFVVLKLEYFQGEPDPETNAPRTGTRATLFVNPDDLTSEEANESFMSEILDDGGPFETRVEGIGIEGNNSSRDSDGNLLRGASIMVIDEIRVGTDWTSVTPLGEPDDGNWAFWTPTEDGDVNTSPDGENFMGWVNVTMAPYIWHYAFNTFVYLPEDYISESGAWSYTFLTAPDPVVNDGWALWASDADSWVDTNSNGGNFMSWVNVFHAPYVIVTAYDGKSVYLPEEYVTSTGAWVYTPYQK